MNRKCLRKNLMPKTLTDACCVLFIFTFVPLTFIFEMCVVLPAFHEAGSFMFILTWLLGTFLLFNIVGNFIFCILEDTSIKSKFCYTGILMGIVKLTIFRHYVDTTH